MTFICDDGVRALACGACDNTFLHRQVGRGRPPSYCGEECSAKGRRTSARRAEKPRGPYDYLCVICGKPGVSGTKTTTRHPGECSWISAQRTLRLAAEKARVGKERPCEHCGSAFYASRANLSSKQIAKGHEQRYCSRACALAAVRVYPDKQAAKSAERARRRARLGLPPIDAEHERQCAECGAVFKVRQASIRKYCSAPCVARRTVKGAIEAAAQRVERPCKECGSAFRPEYGDKRKSFCSDSCARRFIRRIRKKAERARLRSVRVESVNPIEVFERDRWRCHLCGVKTLKSKRGQPHPKAPELEHIVPLAKGGEHSYRNTACACRACNIAKGAAERGQLRLFG